MNLTIRKFLMAFPDEGQRLLMVASNASEMIVGSVSLKIHAQKIGPKSAEFSCLFVREDSRRGGVGEMLMRECADLARGEGCHILSGYVKPSNSGATAFYLKTGFQFGYVWADGDVAITKQINPFTP